MSTRSVPPPPPPEPVYLRRGPGLAAVFLSWAIFLCLAFLDLLIRG